MKKIAIAFILLLGCSAASAEWKKIFVWADSSTSFIEDSNISAQGQYRYAWILTNFGKKRPDGSIAMRRRIHIDCNNSQSRYLNLFTYTSPWARGAIVAQGEVPTTWFPIFPDNAGGDNEFKFLVFKLLCR